MFPVLVRELKQAQKYIFIEYFIINDGVMSRDNPEYSGKESCGGCGCAPDL